MRERCSTVFNLILVFVLMFCLDSYAADTSTITIDPGADTGGDVWKVVTCNHIEPENIRNDGVLQIGWGKTGDIIKLVEPVDFGKGLVSLKAMITYANPLPEDSKIIVKVGDKIIAELTPIVTSAWNDQAEISGVLKEPISGKQIVTFEWLNNSAGLGAITFEVTPDIIVIVATSAATNAATNSATSVPTTTASKATLGTPVVTISSSRAPSTTQIPIIKAQNNTNVIIGIVSIVLIFGGAITTFIIHKKKI